MSEIGYVVCTVIRVQPRSYPHLQNVNGKTINVWTCQSSRWHHSTITHGSLLNHVTLMIDIGTFPYTLSDVVTLWVLSSESFHTRCDISEQNTTQIRSGQIQWEEIFRNSKPLKNIRSSSSWMCVVKSKDWLIEVYRYPHTLEWLLVFISINNSEHTLNPT